MILFTFLTKNWNWLLAVVAIVASMWAGNAPARVYNVTTTSDNPGIYASGCIEYLPGTTGCCADTLVGTLREAILDANSCSDGGDSHTIILPAGDYQLSAANLGGDDWPDGDLDLNPWTADVTIEGAGAASTRILAPANDRVLQISRPVSDIDITLRNLSLENGRSQTERGGGAIYGNRSGWGGPTTLTLEGVVIANNQVVDAPDAGTTWVGGGVYLDNTRALSVRDCRFVANAVMPPAENDASAYGGGLYFHSGGAAVVIEDTAFIDNAAAGSAGVMSAGTGWGGGAWVEGMGPNGTSSVLVVQRCLFADNFVAGGSSSEGWDGSALGGGLGARYVQLTVQSSTFAGNAANAGGGVFGNAIGGGLFGDRIVGDSYPPTIQTSTFTDNTLTGSGILQGGGMAVCASTSGTFGCETDFWFDTEVEHTIAWGNDHGDVVGQIWSAGHNWVGQLDTPR